MTRSKFTRTLAPVLMLAALLALTGAVGAQSGVDSQGTTYDVDECTRYVNDTATPVGNQALVNHLTYDPDSGHEIFHVYTCESAARSGRLTDSGGRTVDEKIHEQALNEIVPSGERVRRTSGMVSWNRVMTTEQFACFQDKTTNPFTDTLESLRCVE